MRKLVVVGAVLFLIAAAGVPAVAGELTFTDHMKPLGLDAPGYAWHAYHDAIVCADWDADGDVDVLVIVSLQEKSPLGSQGRFYVNLLAETGRLGFEDRTEKLVADGHQKEIIADGAPVFMDTDADGDLDLCVISDEHAPLTFVNENGAFRMKRGGFSAQSITASDRDGDGDLDVVGNDTGLIYTNEGAGVFKEARSAEPLSAHMPRDKVLPVPAGITVDEAARTAAAQTGTHVYYTWEKVDFTGDGRDDYALFLSAVYSWKLSRFYAAAASGYRDVTAQTGLPTDAQIAFVDVNGDGKLDAVASGRETGGIFLGDGAGRYAAAPESDATKIFRTVIGGCYPVPQAVADFDADGVPDILVYHYRAGTVSSVLHGLGEGRFARVLMMGGGSGLAMADLNNDGLLDIVSSGPVNTTGLHVWINETKSPGRALVVRLKGTAANPFAANAQVEAFSAGKLGDVKAVLARDCAGPSGLSAILGLGAAERVDLRVTFAPGVIREMKVVKPGSVTVTAEVK